MTPHVHQELIKLWANGNIIQCYLNNSTWIDVDAPMWDPKVKYRVKPEQFQYRVYTYENYYKNDKEDKILVGITSKPKFEVLIEAHNDFVEWVTDWIIVETKGKK
jgi:hypothetical protein